MPNWCSNILTITPKDNKKNTLMELKAFYYENKGSIDGERQDLTFSSGVPLPKKNGELDYDKRNVMWGTKWEPTDVYYEDKGDELHYSFETAWSPPIEWVENVSKYYPNLMFNLEYEEPGMGLYGGINVIDGKIEEYQKDEPRNEEDEVTPEEAYDILQHGGEIMVKGWDPNELRLYAGVSMEDFEGQSKEEIVKTLSEYESIQFWG